jgi:HlyD family secretion protein
MNPGMPSRAVAALATAVAMVSIMGCENTESPLPLVGTLERDRIEIQAEAWETLVEISVSEGERVEAGQTLAIQDPSLVSTRVDQARAARLRAERRLAELERGPRVEEIAAARARLEGAEGQLETDEKSLVRTAELVSQALLSDEALDQVRARRDVSLASRNDAAAVLRELVTGTTAEELDQARAAVGETAAALAEQELELSRLTLRAPVAGTIDTIPYRLGDRPPAGADVMVLLADTAPYARVYIPQMLRARVQVGLRARIAVDGVAEIQEGRVRTVANDATFTPYFSLTERDRSRLAYVAEITLLGEAATDLPVGLPVEVMFPDLTNADAP